jgi:hypothetical protein
LKKKVKPSNFEKIVKNRRKKGNGGETEIYGHKAYFIDGTIYNDAIHSRFIVWNCPKTGRQFISDCNINLRLGTPGYLLETQNHITQTIHCHKGFSKAIPDTFPRTYESEKWNLSFNIPENWKTAEYFDKKWFPNGMSNQNGSLWTLLTDSRKYLELLWEETDVPLNADLFKSFLERITKPFTHEDITLQVSQIKLESIKEEDGYYMGEGSHQFTQVVKEKEYKSDYKFKGLLWKKEKRIYFLFASLIGLKEFWGIKNDLTTARTSRNQKETGLSGKLQIPNPKFQTNSKSKIPNYKTKKVEKKNVCKHSILNSLQTCQKIFCQKMARLYD